jgi:hypothetical protein
MILTTRSAGAGQQERFTIIVINCKRKYDFMSFQRFREIRKVVSVFRLIAGADV